MFRALSQSLDHFMQRYTPDPFLYAIFLTFLVYIASIIVEPLNFLPLSTAWYGGFWELSTFTLQMVMILFGGYLLALSPPVQMLLRRLAKNIETTGQGAVYCTLVGIVGSLINWGFGLIVSAIFCKEAGKRLGGKNYSVLVAASYSGFLVWHGGISGSIPLLVSTPGNFCEKLIGGVIPISRTLGSTQNVLILVALAVVLPLLSWWLMKDSVKTQVHIESDTPEGYAESVSATPVEHLENSPLFSSMLVVLAICAVVSQIFSETFRFDINQINFAFFMLALLLHKTPRRFLQASSQAVTKIWPLLIQYPLYGGILALLRQGGLGERLSEFFVDIATQKTLPWLTFISAGIVNIFVPSGGGQWALQGPIVIKAAEKLQANLDATIMAVAWGDSWTNMIQPFWALPLLTIAGLRARDIMGNLVIVLFVSGLIISATFLIF